MGRTARETVYNTVSALLAIKAHGCAVFTACPGMSRFDFFPWTAGEKKIHRNTIIALERYGVIKVIKKNGLPVKALPLEAEVAE